MGKGTNMILGLIGRGPWAAVWERTLRNMNIGFLQVGRNYQGLGQLVSGVIVASAGESHADIAGTLLEQGVPLIVEKPLCLSSAAAHELLRAAEGEAIVFVNHTRLYSNAWREFKAAALDAGVESIYGAYGGPSKLDHWWDKGAHLVAMCLDLGFDPRKAELRTGSVPVPLRMSVNNDSMIYWEAPESPSPLEVLALEFIEAIEKGERDVRGLELGVKVVDFLEERQNGTDKLGLHPRQGQAGASASTEAGASAEA